MNKNEFNFPTDLAQLVHSYLIKKNIHGSPEIEYLQYLFEVMYFSSLKTEESQKINVTITFLDPLNIDPEPPRRIRKDRWSYIKFDNGIELNIQNLVKLAKAADPKASSLVVGIIENQLVICGMIDQEINYNNFILKEEDSGPERPGIFQAKIEDIGEISVYKDYSHIATLKKNSIIKNRLDVFSYGAISDLLNKYMDPIIKNIKEKVGHENSNNWDDYLKEYALSLICRILIGIQNYKHGGAILIDPNISHYDLNVKYNIEYDRLNRLFGEHGENKILSSNLEKTLFENYYKKRLDDLPLKLHTQLRVYNSTLRDIKDGITGAIKYISSLSCVDGLVLFDNNLIVKGFGCEITANEQPENIVLSIYEEIKDLKKVEYNHFGTRHRSMMRYCFSNHGSIGFVVSQDGEIRAMTRIEDKLVIWENISVYLEFDL